MQHNTNKPIFVVGSRSGTSILTWCLGVPPEFVSSTRVKLNGGLRGRRRYCLPNWRSPQRSIDFECHEHSGMALAHWIETGSQYEFRLYDSDHTELLAKVSVTRTTQ